MTRCKLIKTIAIALCLAMLIAGCGGNSTTSEKPAAPSADVSIETEEKKDTETKEEEPAGETEKENSFSLKSSPDKYTQYVGKYVGMNAASVGYTSLGGDRMVKIGSGYLQITYVTSDSSLLKQYVITGQDIAPNTELKLTFMTDSNGEEYSNLVGEQSYETITVVAPLV